MWGREVLVKIIGGCERGVDWNTALNPVIFSGAGWPAVARPDSCLPSPTTEGRQLGAHDAILDLGQYIGHYVAGSKGKSPTPVLEKYHDRIVSLHLKDRTADGSNVPWGQGQTPIKEMLQLMRQEKWTFPAEPERSEDSQPQAARRASAARQIELEYKIPEGSNAVAEVKKCVQYCQEALA